MPLSQPWVNEDRHSGSFGGGFGWIRITDGGGECSHKLKINNVIQRLPRPRKPFGQTKIAEMLRACQSWQ